MFKKIVIITLCVIWILYLVSIIDTLYFSSNLIVSENIIISNNTSQDIKIEKENNNKTAYLYLSKWKKEKFSIQKDNIKNFSIIDSKNNIFKYSDFINYNEKNNTIGYTEALKWIYNINNFFIKTEIKSQKNIKYLPFYVIKRKEDVNIYIDLK